MDLDGQHVFADAQLGTMDLVFRVGSEESGRSFGEIRAI